MILSSHVFQDGLFNLTLSIQALQALAKMVERGTVHGT